MVSIDGDEFVRHGILATFALISMQ